MWKCIDSRAGLEEKSMCLTKYHAMKTCGSVEVVPTGQEAVDPRAGLYAVVKRDNPLPAPVGNRTAVVEPVV
jgi:hypothetical protein